MNGPGDSHDSPSAVALDEENGVLVGAGTTREDAGGEQREIGAWHTVDATAVAFDPATGEERWRYKWDLSDRYDGFRSLSLDDERGIAYIGGWTTNEAGHMLGLVVALDTVTGQPSWSQTIASPHGEPTEEVYIYDIAVTPRDRVVVVAAYPAADGGHDTHVRSFHARNGSLAWSLTETVAEGSFDEPLSLEVSPDGTEAWIGGSLPDHDHAYVMKVDLFDPQVDWTVSEPTRWGSGNIEVSPSRGEVYDLMTSSGRDYKIVTRDAQTGAEKDRLLTGVPEEEPNVAHHLALAADEGVLVATGQTNPRGTVPTVWTGTVGIDAETHEILWKVRGEDPPAGVSTPWDLHVPDSEDCVIVAGTGGTPWPPSRMQITSYDLRTGEALLEVAYMENPVYQPFPSDLATTDAGDALFVAASQLQMTADVRPSDPNTATQNDWLMMRIDDPCDSRGPLG